LGRSS